MRYDQPEYLKDKSLIDLQRLYFSGAYCPYCNEPTVWVDSIEVYQESMGMVYLCRPCKAYCGTHPESPDHSYGFVAREDLRKLRSAAHFYFDPLWQHKITEHEAKRKSAQSDARKWLAGFLGIEVPVCHIGMMDIPQCLRVIAECKKYYLSAEQHEAIKVETINRIGILKALSESIEVDVKLFDLNGFTQMEFTHLQTTKVLLYNPKRNMYTWNTQTKNWKPVEDIYQFLYTSFKIEKT